MTDKLSIDAIIQMAVSEVMAQAAPRIAAVIAHAAAAQCDRELTSVIKSSQEVKRSRARARSRPQDLTRWVANHRARRVPKFVIEMTNGLDTKKKIVAKFGAGAAFEKGKPLPKPV